MKQFNDITQ
jgi:hypothetical protein